MEDFINLLMKNLRKNNFPERKVSFDLETLYETADAKGLSFNKVLATIKKQGVHHIKKGDKVIFFSEDHNLNQATSHQHMNDDVSPDFLAQAKAMMDHMSADELTAAQNLVQERFKTMSDEEKSQMFEQMKKMGLM